jgi:hypothetical protein
MLDVLVASLKRILMLLVGFTLPRWYKESPKYLGDLLADLDRSTIAYQLGGSSMVGDVISKSTRELSSQFHTIAVCKCGTGTNEYLSVLLSTIDCRSVRLNSVGSDRFIMTYNVKGRIGGLEALAEYGVERHPCILCSLLKSLANNIDRKKTEAWTK